MPPETRAERRASLWRAEDRTHSSIGVIVTGLSAACIGAYAAEYDRPFALLFLAGFVPMFIGERLRGRPPRR